MGHYSAIRRSRRMLFSAQRKATMITEATIKRIWSVNDHDQAIAIAFDACKRFISERDVIATSRDNGWSTTAIYTMPDGGEIRLDGRGWWATLPNGSEIFHR